MPKTNDDRLMMAITEGCVADPEPNEVEAKAAEAFQEAFVKPPAVCERCLRLARAMKVSSEGWRVKEKGSYERLLDAQGVVIGIYDEIAALLDEEVDDAEDE